MMHDTDLPNDQFYMQMAISDLVEADLSRCFAREDPTHGVVWKVNHIAARRCLKMARENFVMAACHSLRRT